MKIGTRVKIKENRHWSAYHDAFVGQTGRVLKITPAAMTRGDFVVILLDTPLKTDMGDEIMTTTMPDEIEILEDNHNENSQCI